MREFFAWLRDLIANWHMGQPPATTFAEGQQALMVKLLARAGIVGTAIVVGLSVVLLYLLVTDQLPAERKLILYIIAGVVGLYGLTNLAIVLSYAVGGPVGRIDLEATRQGFKAGASKKDPE